MSAQQVTTRLLGRAALVALPAAIAALLFGPVGLMVALLLFGGLLLLPPLLGSGPVALLASLPGVGLSAGGVLALVILLLPLALLLPMILGVLVTIAIVALVALGWMGIGPLAGPIAMLRTLGRLLVLLPNLAQGLRAISKAASQAALAGGEAANGIGGAADRVGDLRAGLLAVQVPTLSATPTIHNISVVDLGVIPVPGWQIDAGSMNPVPALATDALDEAQVALRAARDRVNDQKAAIVQIAEALADMADLIEGR
jgi:hypothetical protein